MRFVDWMTGILEAGDGRVMMKFKLGAWIIWFDHNKFVIEGVDREAQFFGGVDSCFGQRACFYQ